MAFLDVLFLADAFEDLKNIADKIIPNDPWAFVIQLTSTFILVFILAKFLVKPAREYIEKRTAYIQNNLDEAASKNSEADAKLLDANSQIKEAKNVSKELVENAKVVALNEKDRILLETKEEVEALKAKAHNDIANERKQMQEEFEHEAVNIVIEAASKVVEREVNEADNHKLVEDFIKNEVNNG